MNDPITKSVSNAYKKMKAEELTDKQKKHIDKNNNNKIDSHDFKLLRKEEDEVEDLDEDKYDRMLSNMVKKNPGVLKTHSKEVQKYDDISSGKKLDRQIKKNPGVLKTHSAAVKKDKKMYGEDIEHIDEVKMADLPSTKVQGRSYGASKPEPHAVDTLRGPKEKELKDIEAEKKKKQKKKPFSEMLETYKSAGLKSLFEAIEEKAFAEEVESIEEEDTGYMDRYAVKNGKAVKDNPKQRNYDDDEPHHVYADSPEHAVRKYAKMKKPGMKKEEVEELDELSKDTLNSYVKKSFSDKEKDNLNTPERQKGLRKATSRLYKEDEEHIEELSTPTLASYVKKVGHEGAWTKKRTAGVNSALNKVKQNSMKSEEMDIDAINGVRMHTFKERFGDRDNNN
jgi:hypothetical protein